ncbi:MAG: CoA-binding protein [Rhodocyclaceae bacterium]|nr:CoA-binding protein [Rhodocyclaceae bacterium]
MFKNPDTAAIAALLKNAKIIAVVGLSPKPGRDSHHVAEEMQRFGYRIIPVRPALDSVLGEKAYGSLSDIPPELRAQIDIVDVFRAAEHIPAIVDECLALGLKTLWVQLGIVHEEAAEKAVANGMTVIMDRCIYVDRMRLVGNDQERPVLDSPPSTRD